jgi:Flp pilus assembly pilin Flp
MGSRMTTSYELVNDRGKAHMKSERGPALVERALRVALCAVVCIAAVTMQGQSLSSKFSTISASIAAG